MIKGIFELLNFITIFLIYSYHFYYFYPIKCKFYGSYSMGYGFALVIIIPLCFLLNLIIIFLSKSNDRRIAYFALFILFVLMSLSMPYPCYFSDIIDKMSQ